MTDINAAQEDAKKISEELTEIWTERRSHFKTMHQGLDISMSPSMTIFSDETDRVHVHVSLERHTLKIVKSEKK